MIAGHIWEGALLHEHTSQSASYADDAVLFCLARGRDEGAVRTIMQRHNRRLFRIARSILHDDSEAEDAVQDAYVCVFRTDAAFSAQSSLGTWLTRVVMNEALARKRKRLPPLQWVADRGQALMAGKVVNFPVADNIDPERAMAQGQIRAVIEQAIDELPAAFRTVLVARVLEGMSVEETATLLELRPETVKTRLHRARRALRRSLERQIGPWLVDAFPFEGRRCERLTEAVLQRLSASDSGNL